MDHNDIVRVANLFLASLNFVLLLMLVRYLRGLYRPETRGRDHRRFIAAKLGTFCFFLYGAIVLFAALNGAHHAFDTPVWLNFISRVGVFGGQVGVFIALMSWHAMMLEDKYRGRWPKLDHTIERFLHLNML